MDKKPVNFKYGGVALSKVSYLFSTQNLKNGYQIEYEDKVLTSNFTDSGFDVTYTRESVTNEPFKFFIEFIFHISDVNKNDLENNQEQIKDFAERKKIDIVNIVSLPSRASLLISNITRESGGAFVTIPAYFEAKKN